MGGFGEPLIGALGVAALIGIAWLVVVLGERRRRGLQQRLATLAPGARSPVAQLRLEARGNGALAMRALPQTVLPGAGPIQGRLQARFELELAAAGNRIGPVHLIVAGLVAMLLASGFVSNLLGFGPITSFFLGLLAGLGAAALMLRWAQQRYRRKFLDFLPDAVDMVARGVKAGLMPMDSLRFVASEIPEPVGSEFQKALREMDLGVEMTEALQRGEGIEIRGFGSFTVRPYKPYSGRNPRTGQPVDVPAKRLPFFKVGKELKEIVNESRHLPITGGADDDGEK